MKSIRVRIVTAVSLNSLLLIAFGVFTWILVALGDPLPQPGVDIVAIKQEGFRRATNVLYLMLGLSGSWIGLSLFWRAHRRWISYIIVIFSTLYIFGNIYVVFKIWRLSSFPDGLLHDPLELLFWGVLLLPIAINVFIISTIVKGILWYEHANTVKRVNLF
jgi:hypothetical protein